MSEATLKKKDRSKPKEKTPLELMATFVAPPILRRYNDDPTKPDGPQERRHTGAVLFLDISGFTKMTEALAEKGAEGTEQITRILNHHFDTLVGIVESFSGEVVKYAGDAFAAIWICPLAGKDIRQVVHRASTCALKMQQARQSLEKKHKTKLLFKIGIGCGNLKLTHVGGVNDKWDLLVKGAALEQAVFAEGCAVPGDSVVSHKAWECIASVASGKEHASGNYFLKGLKKQAKSRVVKERLIKPEAEAAIRLYVPASVTSRIDVGQGAYIGELRQATIMFCNLPDIRSRASVDKDQRIIEEVQRVIFKYEGAINKLSIDDKGVSVLAVWGLPPLVHENDPERAVRAGLGIQEVFGPKKIRCSIGVTTGQAFSGAIGGETRKEYTVIGDVVNLSARLMQNAKGGILSDISTYNACQQKIQFKPLSEITVKGKSKPIKIFRPVGAGGASVKITENKKFIVGRKKERSILNKELKGLELDTISRVLVIQGEPGTGKSHLVHHTMQLANDQNIKSFIGEASSIETSTPYLAWRGLFIQLLGFNERGRRQSPKDIILKMLKSNPEFEKRAPVLNEVLNIRIPENDYSRKLGGKVRAERAQELLIHLLQILTSEERYIFVLEDAHWFDTASWELLMALVQNITGVIVLLTTRAMPLPPPTWYVQLLRRKSTQMMRIGNLSKGEAGQLVAFKLGVKEIPEALQTMVYEHSQGNPFFTHELALTLEDEGMVMIDDGVCKLPPNFGAKGHLEVPNTIEGVVGSRIDALSPPQQLALKVASVIGRSFELKLLAAVYPVEQDREDLGRHLDSLRARGFVDQDKVGKTKLFIFHHVITQEVSYKLMLFDQRRVIHREIALWMEDLKKGQTKGFYGLLAHHWSHTDNVKKAYGYLDKAGELARRAGAYQESADFFSRALELADNPDIDEVNRAEDAKRAGWQRKLSDSFFAMGRGKESADYANRALATLGRPQPTNERGWKILLFKGALRQLFHQMVPKSLVVVKDDDLRQQCMEFSFASRRLAEIFYYEHAELQMMGTSLLCLNMAERVGKFHGTCFAYSMFARVLGARGQHRKASRYFGRARRMAESINAHDAMVFNDYSRAGYQLGRGKHEGLEELIEEAVDLAGIFGDKQEIETTLDMMGHYQYFTGKFESALETADKIVESAKERGNRQREGFGALAKARALVAMGKFDVAITSINQVKSSLKAIDDPGAEVVCYGLLALTELRRGNLGEAQVAANEALGRCQTTDATVFYNLPGYEGGAEVYLELWRQAIESKSRFTNSLEKLARGALYQLNQFSDRFQFALPSQTLMSARHAHILGDMKRAGKELEKARVEARRVNMPYLEAQILFELSRFPGTPKHLIKYYRTEAQDLFWRMRCHYFVESIEESQ